MLNKLWQTSQQIIKSLPKLPNKCTKSQQFCTFAKNSVKVGILPVPKQFTQTLVVRFYNFATLGIIYYWTLFLKFMHFQGQKTTKHTVKKFLFQNLTQNIYMRVCLLSFKFFLFAPGKYMYIYKTNTSVKLIFVTCWHLSRG